MEYRRCAAQPPNLVQLLRTELPLPMGIHPVPQVCNDDKVGIKDTSLHTALFLG
jgi:hypothetical protein